MSLFGVLLETLEASAILLSQPPAPAIVVGRALRAKA